MTDRETEAVSQVARVEPGEISPGLVTALQTGAVVCRADTGVLTLAGPGAVTCFQGLLTNDVELPGDGSFVYGALLTPKGMIVVDGWAARLDTTVTYTVPADGRDRAHTIFTRSVPPRLARVADRTADVVTYRMAGPRVLAVAGAAGLTLPSGPGRVLRESGPDGVETARASEGAPFVLQITAPAPVAPLLADRLRIAGAISAGPAALELLRVLAGWPRLGAEMDERTIPQEVRFDEIGVVSYTKGCYTGQETVARVHFRGHVNRYLRGVQSAVPIPPGAELFEGDRSVGEMKSRVISPRLGPIGLAMLRREVATDAELTSRWENGEATVRVRALPFG